MTEQRFPKDWDEEGIERLIAELDARTDEEWIAADEADPDMVQHLRNMARSGARVHQMRAQRSSQGPLRKWYIRLRLSST